MGTLRQFGATITSGITTLDRATWLRSIPLALTSALLIAIPADLIDTPLFGRPVEARAIDYLILAITAGLIGLILAIRPAISEPAIASQAETQERNTVWSGFVSFLAVGCPVCNQAVVALVGTSGALSWWAPVQPLIGLIAVALLVWTLHQRLTTYQLTACPI